MSKGSINASLRSRCGRLVAATAIAVICFLITATAFMQSETKTNVETGLVTAQPWTDKQMPVAGKPGGSQATS